MTLIDPKNTGERWEQLGDQFNAVVARYEHHNSLFRRDMSYWPEAPGQQAAN